MTPVEHIRLLAKKLKVRLIEDSGIDWGDAQMIFSKESIGTTPSMPWEDSPFSRFGFNGVLAVPSITDDKTYAAGLHELGHAATSRRGKQKFEERIKEEKLAWKWARENALYWTDEMSEAEIFSLRTYEERLPEMTGKLV